MRRASSLVAVLVGAAGLAGCGGSGWRNTNGSYGLAFTFTTA